MFENIGHFFKKIVKTEPQKELGSKDAAKERLHLVLMQDRANVSADFLELMKQEIIDVIKKYIVVDEDAIDVRLTNQTNDDGTNGAPSLYANIPIVNIKNDMMAEKIKDFEGVDFNKEMGIPTYVDGEATQEKKTLNVIELPENYEKMKNSSDSNEGNSKKENDYDKDSSENDESEEVKEVFQEVDDVDDDDDVTFDDLLKAAEAAEKLAEESTEKKKNMENKEGEVSKKSTKSTANTDNDTKDKRKKKK